MRPVHPSPSDLSRLSRLFDEALLMHPRFLETWLRALHEEDAHLAGRLRAMLTEHAMQAHAGFMAGVARLSEAVRAGDATPGAGDAVGPYCLIREIGRGGMGAVWLADRIDGSLRRSVALKLPRLSWDQELAKRMERERDIGALLEHPNIARLYDAGVDASGRPYLAFEYIDGQPLDAWCESQGLSTRQRLRLFVQVARAVAHAHARLVVHRDLKPSNILVSADGQVHLLDFGIAKLLHDSTPASARLTQDNDRLLTPHFASPEQIRGDPITVQSDVYSLGVLLYELLSGHHPYAAEEKGLVFLERAMLAGEPRAASLCVSHPARARSLRGEVDAILAKALRREAAERYATADAFVEDIERHLGGERVLARPDSAFYRFSKLVGRHRASAAAACAVLVAVLATAVISVVQARRATDAADRARVVKEFVIDVFKINSRDSTLNADLRRLPAELLLERGAKLIEAKFAKQPQLQAELFGVVGKIFADMGSSRLAADYAMRQSRALNAMGASDADKAAAGLLLATALLEAGQLHEARTQASAVLALTESETEAATALHPDALVLLARILYVTGESSEASRLLDRLDRDQPVRALPTAIGARAKRLRGLLASRAHRPDEAMRLFITAIDEALAAEGPLSPVAVDIRMDADAELLNQDRAGEAKAYREAALAVLRSTGGAGDVRAALMESNVASNMVWSQQITFAEAKAIFERNRDAVLAGGPLVPKSIKAGIDLDLGQAYLLWGDVATGGSLVSESASVLRAATDNPLDIFAVATAQGDAAKYAGRHDDANRYYREMLEMRVRGGQGGSPWAVYDHAYVAINLGMQGRYDDAEAVLRAAPSPAAGIDLPRRPMGDSAGAQHEATVNASPSTERLLQVVQRTLARIELDRGEPAAALALLPSQATDSQRLLPFDDWQLRGEVFCAAGRRVEGLELLEQSLAWQSVVVWEHHPDLARARSQAGLCALALGLHGRARALAAMAHASFAMQHELSPYFRRPLEELDRRLGDKQVARDGAAGVR